MSTKIDKLQMFGVAFCGNAGAEGRNPYGLTLVSKLQDQMQHVLLISRGYDEQTNCIKDMLASLPAWKSEHKQRVDPVEIERGL